MAIGLVQLVSSWAAGRTHTESARARSIRMSSNYDVLLDMDGYHDIYPCLRAVPAHPSFWGGDVWYLMGCLPGKPCT
jgi:hypothetical protein